MDHKRIIMPAIERLEAERAGYFADLVHRMGEDKRLDQIGNLVFILLKVALPALPTILPKKRFMDELFQFCDKHAKAIARVIYSPGFVTDEKLLKPIADKFVTHVVGIALKAYEDGEIEDESSSRVKRYLFDDH